MKSLKSLSIIEVNELNSIESVLEHLKNIDLPLIEKSNFASSLVERKKKIKGENNK